MKHKYLFFLLLFLVPFAVSSQIFIGFSPSDSTGKYDSISATLPKPDADRDDIPFIDYKPGVIWNTKFDSVCDGAYIRKNFTDQMVSVWSHPGRLYPASRIYGVDIDGKHYRAVKVSNQNYVFAEQLVKGKMNLYSYRKISQTNGWVEFRGYLHSGYRNNMIIEDKETRGVKNNFGYYISFDDDSLRLVSTSKFKTFVDNYLSDTPETKAIASKFAGKNSNKQNKIAVAGLMTIGIVGLALTGGTGASLIFLAGFPAAIVVAYINRPHTLHWQDMVEIVNSYNKEKGK